MSLFIHQKCSKIVLYTKRRIQERKAEDGYDYRTIDQLPDGTLCAGGISCSDGHTEVLAAAKGVVTKVNRSASTVCSRNENCPEGPGEVKIDHGNGYVTIYLHMTPIKVEEGQFVQQGEVIGISDSIGAKNNPHLHFEVRKNIGGNIFVPVDPYGWNKEAGNDPYTKAENIRLWR